jgi:hypothetical protein
MRFHPEPYRLSFLLPDGAQLERALSRYKPQFKTSSFDVHAAGLVVMTGRSREQLFTESAAFLREARLPPPRAIGCVLVTPRAPGMPSGRDGWTIIVGATVVFSPTSLPPYFPQEPRGPPLELVPGGRAA